MKIFFLSLLMSVSMLPMFVSAFELNLDYPKFGPFDLNTNQNLSEIIAYAYYLIVGIAGLTAFVMLVWGGVQWLTSGAIPSQAGEARDKIKNAILGLLLVLASFLIIQVINPELTILSGKPYPPIDCDKVKGKCQRLHGYDAGGSMFFRFPQSDTREGIFLCKQKQCGCASSVCVAGTNPSTADYLYIDPADVGIATGPGGSSQPGLTTLGDWNDKIRAIAIRGDYGVLLTDGTDYTQTTTCFDGGDSSKGGRLDDFARKSSGELWGFNGAQSIKVLKGGKCQNPGVTLNSEVEFWNDNTVFLFGVTDQGKCDGSPGCGGVMIRYITPLDYFWPGNLRAPASLPVLSMHITQSSFGDPSPWAVRLWETTNARSPGERYICFRDPVDDLAKYVWDSSDPSSTIKDHIGVVEAITTKPCSTEQHGKVLLWP